MSSSQLLQSLLGSCSLNEGLDSDTTAAPSPQPSLGETIKAAAQLSCLEPGLASKPPLPPTPDIRSSKTSLCNDNHNSEEDEIMDDKTLDEIIAMKFQRWFPDSVVGKESPNLTALQQRYPSDETTDDSDAASRTSFPEGELSVEYFSNKTTKSKSTDQNMKQKRNDSRMLRKEPNKTLKNRPMSSRPLNKTKRNVKSLKTSDPQIKLREIDNLSSGISKISKILHQNSDDIQSETDFKLRNKESIIEENRRASLNENNHFSLTMCENQTNVTKDGMPSFLTGTPQNEEALNQNESYRTYQNEEILNQNGTYNQSFSINKGFLNFNKTEHLIQTHNQAKENKSDFNENNLVGRESVTSENKDNFVGKDEALDGKIYLIRNENGKPECSDNTIEHHTDRLQNTHGINNSVKITVSQDSSPPPKEESDNTTMNPNYLTVARDQVSAVVRKSFQENSASTNVLPKMEYENEEDIKYCETRHDNAVLYDFMKEKNLEGIEKYHTHTEDYTRDKNKMFIANNNSLLPGMSSEHTNQVNSVLYISEISGQCNEKINTTRYNFDGNKDTLNPDDFGMSGQVKLTKFSSNFSNNSCLQVSIKILVDIVL